MSSSKKIVARSAKSSKRYIAAKLSQIVCDKQNDYCHRQSDVLKDDRVAPLADNLVSEGQGTAMTVFDSGKRDPILGIIYILIGGFRRFFALLFAIKQNLDHNLIKPDMEIDVIEIVRGPDQTDEEFQRDLLIRSVAENEQRLNFTTNEKLEIAKRFKATKTPTPRAASALCISETQYQRFVVVVEHPWLHEYVVNNRIGATDAAELIQLAKKKNRVDDFKKVLDAWVKKHVALIEAERQELAKIKKKLSGAAAQVKKYAVKKLIKHWVDCLENGKQFDDNVGFLFGIRIDPAKGTISIPATELTIADLTSANIAMVIGELQEKADECIPLLRQRRMLEQSTEMSPDEIEAERKQIQTLRRQEKQKRAEAEAGQPAEDFHEVEKLHLRSIDEGIGEDADEDTDDQDVSGVDTDEDTDQDAESEE